ALWKSSARPGSTTTGTNRRGRQLMKMLQRGLVAALLILAAPVGSAGADPGVTDKEIVIGSCAALEGAASFLGTQTVLGARACLNTVDNLVGTLGRKKIAVLYQEDAFGVAVLEGVKIALKKHNLEPVALGTFPRNTMDVGKGLEQIKPANPEAVVMVGTYAPLAEFVK